MSVLMRQSRQSQPQQATGIDWGNPITRGLVFVANGDALDAAGKKQKATTGAVGIGVNALGRFPSYSGGARNSYPAFGSELTSTTPATIFWIQEPRSGALYSTVAQFRPSGAANPFLIYQSTSDASYRFVVGPHNGAVPNFSTLIGAPTDGVANKFAVVCSTNLASRTFADYVVYKNGVANTTIGGTNFGASSATQTTIGANDTGGDPFEGLIGNFCIWNRALSDAEIKSLSDNPWQIFQPVNRAIWVPVSAAGGSPYTLTADAGAVPLAGTDTGLAFNRTMAADTANIPTAGTDAGLVYSRKLVADTTNLAITGNAATLTYTPIGGPTYTLTADAANAAISGNATGLAFNRKLIADTASTAISGAATGLARGYTLAANSGSVGVSASDAALIAVRKMVADAYALAIAGADATLTYTPLTLPTIGRPTSDTSNTGWTASTGSDLYAMLDEVTPSDTDYISSNAVGQVCKMALNATDYPGTASQVLKYRASSSTGSSVIVRLKEGATTIRAETQALTATDTEYSITLTSGEIAAITSGSLSVELESA